VLSHSQDVAGRRHLRTADSGQVLADVRAVHRWIQDVAALAAGARDDEYVDALGRRTRDRGGALARLVVGVGVHCHQSELLHCWFLSLGLA
jgi:hypothetical protein